MKTLLYFVRHGQVDNPQDIWYGRLPGYGLNTAGQIQITQAALYLMTQSINQVYSSRQLRARQSAEIIRQTLNLPKVHFSSSISEIKTSFQGQTFAAARAIHDNIFASKDTGYVGETIEQVAMRMQHFVHEMIKKHTGERIVAVTHGDPIMLLRALINEMPIANESIRPKDGTYITHGEVYLVTVEDNKKLYLQRVFKP